jgi:nucleoside-diphosphate-sugar epimerase
MELNRLSGIMNLVIARLFFPYGPGQSGRLIPGLAAGIQAGRPVRLNNAEGSPRINPIFIADVVDALAGLIERAFSGVINLAGPDTLTIRELAESIGRHLGKSVDFDMGDRPPFDILGDNTRLHALMPDLKMTGIDQGLSQFLKAKAGLT